MFTRPWVIPQIENYRNANFVITVVTASCHHNDNLGDDNVGIWDKMTTICLSFPDTPFFKRLKYHCNLFLMVQLIINQNWFRQWLGTEKTLSHYLSQGWSRPMVHIRVSPIDWVDYFTVLGKYIHAEKNGTVWAHEGCFHPHIWKRAILTPQVGSGRGRVDHIL